MNRSKKQTIKLKVGRRLPKGDNLTDTTFQTRKIQIRSQEKEYVGRPEDKQKFDILEFLKSLHSNNVSTKLNMLTKLSEFVSSTVDSDYFNDIFSSLLDLMLNEEAEVRKKVLKIMDNLLQKSSAANCHPHFPKLKSCISCAMTHLNAGIRHDSLKLLVLNLTALPNIVCKLHILLDKVLGLISHKPKTKMSKGAHSNSLLTVRPGYCESTLKWRNSVLNCIFLFFQANVACVKPKDEARPMPDWNPKSQFSVQQFNPVFCYSYGRDSGVILSDGLMETDFNTDETAFKDFINYLIPVLFEMWIEVAPSTDTDSLDIKTLILNNVCLLFEWISYTESKEYLEGVFYSVFNAKMREKFFQYFPCPNRSYINDQLCRVYCDIVAKAPHSENLSGRVSEFLMDSINQDLKAAEMAHILQLLKILLKYQNIAHLYKEHLDALYLSIGNSKDQHYREVVFNFFLSLMRILPQLTTKDESHILIKVLKLIPTEFITVSTDHIEGLHREFFNYILRITGCWKFGIEQGIAEHFCKIARLMASNNVVIRKVAVRLIGKSQFITQKQFAAIASMIRQEDVALCTVEDLCAELASQIDYDPVFQMDHFLFFLMNLEFGQALLDEDTVEKPFSNFENSIPFKLSSYTVVNANPSTKDFTNIIIRFLYYFPERNKAFSLVQMYLTHVLEKLHIISFSTALSVLKLAKHLMKIVPGTAEFWVQVANLNVGCFLYAIAFSAQFSAQNSDGGKDPNQDLYIKLLNHTFNIKYLYNVLAEKSAEIKDTSHACYVEQLIVQIFNAPIEAALGPEDHKAIAIFFLILETRFKDYFSELEWFRRVYSMSSQYL